MRRILPLGFFILLFLTLASARVWGQAHQGGHGQPAPQKEASPAPIRTTMEALHQSGGIPPGWKFLLRSGNPEAGRKVFVDLGCYSCHEVKGEQFPIKPGEKRDVGPELTGAGAAHPAEYFAEAIVNPNRVILIGPGYTGPDGLSKMPSYNDDLTVTQLVDLVAYLKSLTAGGMRHGNAREEPNPHSSH